MHLSPQVIPDSSIFSTANQGDQQVLHTPDLSECVGDSPTWFELVPYTCRGRNPNFERPFTPRGWLRLARNFAKTRFRWFPTFHFSTPETLFFRNFCKLWRSVYPPRMAPIDLKLGQNAFQVIPELSLFDVEDRKIFGFFGHDHFVLARTHVSWPKTHVSWPKTHFSGIFLEPKITLRA